MACVGLGQAFIVENKPGAGTNIAVKSVITAEPDGYTLMMAANALAANMSLYQPQPFDAEKDLVAISLIGRVPVVIAANANAPFANVKQLIEAAKGKPNSIAYGSPGNGSTPHMAIELLEREAGIQLQHVPYRGGGPAMNDVMGGQVPLFFANVASSLGHIKAGKLRPLAVTSTLRARSLPDVPTMAEAGVSGYEVLEWNPILGPAGMAADVKATLVAAIRKALEDAEVLGRCGPDNGLFHLRFAGNPLVCGYPNIRFYAGCPLISPEGFALGTLCVIDHAPRQLSNAEADTLRRLARHAQGIGVGNLAERLDSHGAPKELLPMIDSFNTMLERLEGSMSFMSSRVGTSMPRIGTLAPSCAGPRA